MTENETLVVSGLSVEVTRKAKLKNLYIRVNPPDGIVTVPYEEEEENS